MTLRKNDSRRSPKLWENGFLLHRDNGSKLFLADKCVTRRRYSSYSTDLALCDFFFLAKVESLLRRIRFETFEVVEEETMVLLTALTKDQQRKSTRNEEVYQRE